MRARYIRVSSISQNEERQLVKANEGEVLFIDKISGTIPFHQRPQARELSIQINENKINYLTVSSIDRLGRNLIDILNVVEFLHSFNVNLKVDNLGIESLTNGKENPVFKLIVSVLANIAEMERNTMLERQKEGIELAKAKGVYQGREKGTIISNEEILKKYANVVKYLKKVNPPSMVEIGTLCACNKNTVLKVKKILNEQTTYKLNNHL